MLDMIKKTRNVRDPCFSPEMCLKLGHIQIKIICSADSTVLFLNSSCFGDNDSTYEHMSHCLASASLLHTLTEMESELWEALHGGMALR